MTRRRRTPEQIIRSLAEGHKLLAAGGATVVEVCRRLEIAESTWAPRRSHPWIQAQRSVCD